MKNRYIELHTLTAYPPSNLNRDDTGQPKTVKIGNAQRLRASSQCLKSAWRKSSEFQECLSDNLGTRTKKLGADIYQKCVDGGITHKNAIDLTLSILEPFGKTVAATISEKKSKPKKEVAEENSNETNKILPTDEKIQQEIETLKLEQLVFFDVEELKNINTIVERSIETKKKPTKEEIANLLCGSSRSVDIALWGRMLTSPKAPNIEAACQVSHSFSVHSAIVEDDYFTAVDDLNSDNTKGAAHLGENGYAAGLFYLYVVINTEILINNLGGDLELAKKAIAKVVTAIATVSPTGKQNSYGSQVYASYILAEVGNSQPRSLSVAFLKPIDYNIRGSIDFGKVAVDALDKQCTYFDKVYGDHADKTYIINTFEGTGELKELISMVIE